MSIALKPSKRFAFIALLCLALMLTACRRNAASGGPTLQPTLTPTPRSTPLPELDPTAIPGTEDSPIQMVLLRPAGVSERVANNAADDLAEALAETANLTVEVNFLDTTAEAIAALCGSSSGAPTAAWLNGVAFAAARAQGCGTAGVWVRVGTGSNATATETIQLIANGNADISGPAGFADPDVTVCRLGFADLNTWIVPSLILQANNVQPTSILNVEDREDVEALITAVAEGDCTAAGVSARDFDDVAEGTVRSAISVLNADAEVPLAVLTYPLEVPLGARLAINEALADIDGDIVEGLFNANSIVPVDEDELDSFIAFLNRTGLDFAALGS